MNHSAWCIGAPRDFIEYAERRVIRLARVDHHREGELVCERELSCEEIALGAGGLRRIVEVQSDFAHRSACVCGVKCAYRFHRRVVRGGVASLVAVRAERKACRIRRERLCEKGGAVQLRGATHGHEARDARRACACESGGRFFAVFREMCVCIVDVHEAVLAVFGAILPKARGGGKLGGLQILLFWTCTRGGNVR